MGFQNSVQYLIFLCVTVEGTPLLAGITHRIIIQDFMDVTPSSIVKYVANNDVQNDLPQM